MLPELFGGVTLAEGFSAERLSFPEPIRADGLLADSVRGFNLLLKITPLFILFGYFYFFLLVLGILAGGLSTEAPAPLVLPLPMGLLASDIIVLLSVD